MSKKAALVTGDCWQGLYIDGKLVAEGHELSFGEVFELLGVECRFISADDDWLAENGSLPEDLSEVKGEE